MRILSFSLTLVLLLLLISLPYLQAVNAGGEHYIFNGFLLNPLDGNSYLAKMYQGWRGDWRFTLPFTAEPGTGTWLFLFYLFLGHLAHWTGCSLLAVFHGSRLIAAVVLSVTLFVFLRRSLPQGRWLQIAYFWASLGAGMGWVLALSGQVTSDYWVAEAFPFLSSYANPHFPLSLAALLGLFMPAFEEVGQRAGWRSRWHPIMFSGLLAFGLAILSPFGVVLATLTLGGLVLWQAIENWRLGVVGLRLLDGENTGRLVGVLVGGAPLLLYDWWIVRHHPALAIWDAQNLTPTPPWWDLLLSFAPAWVLALPGAWQVARASDRRGRVSVVWAVLAVALLVAPLGLQRRFMIGLYVPLVCLAGYGLDLIAKRLEKSANLLAVLAVLLALPTNLFLLLAAAHGIQTHDRLLYRSRAEDAAFTWIRQQTPMHALVLAAPETGLLIPAWTGRRVIYGHPFETVHAQAEQQAVASFYADPVCDPDFLHQRAIEYIFWGPRETALAGRQAPEGDQAIACSMELVFQQDDVMIYRVLEP